MFKLKIDLDLVVFSLLLEVLNGTAIVAIFVIFLEMAAIQEG